MNILVIEDQAHAFNFKPLGGNSSRVLELVSWDLLKLYLVVAEDSWLVLLVLLLNLAEVQKVTRIFPLNLRGFDFRHVNLGLTDFHGFTSLALAEGNLLGEVFRSRSVNL